MNIKIGGIKMSHWKQFAEILDLEMEQEFVLTDVNGNRKNEYIYKITEDGLLYKMPTLVKWSKSSSVNWSNSSSCTILRLLNGDYKVLAKPWKPTKGETYWHYGTERGEAFLTTWCFDSIDLCRWKAGNCFKTREEAETKGKEIMEQIQKEYEEN